MDTCDVLIIGGGPAGSSCARELCRAGLDVVVLDKKIFPRDKTCAGWVTPAVIDSLRLDAADYARGRVFQPITGFRVGPIEGPQVESFYDHPVSFGIRRCEFDQYLLARCGARQRVGEPFKEIKRTHTGWRVNGDIEAAMVIGAGGHACPIARYLGAGSETSETVVAAQEIEFKLTPEQLGKCEVRPEIPELYFCTDLKGYAWCFRKGEHLNIGLGREDNHNLSEHVQGFLAQLKEMGRVPADTPDRFHGHAYILYGHTRRKLLDDGMMLIGDAAGLAYPQSGEGIRTAVESGMLAARTIIEARGDYRQVSLQPYAQRLVKRFGPPQSSDGWAAMIPEAWKQALAGRLLGMPWFARHVVIDRWFLHRQQPALQAEMAQATIGECARQESNL